MTPTLSRNGGAHIACPICHETAWSPKAAACSRWLRDHMVQHEGRAS